MKFWFSLSTITVTTKVSVDAWTKVRRLAAGRYKIGDVLSAMIMVADEKELMEKLSAHLDQVNDLPKSVKSLLKEQDKLSPEARKLISDTFKQ